MIITEIGIFDFYCSDENSSQEHTDQYIVFERYFHSQLFKIFLR